MDKVIHFEIPAKKLERAKTFYTKTFGWKTVEYPEMKYTILQTAKTDEKGMIQEIGSINGGMMEQQGKIKNPVITIGVENIEDSIAKVKENGGKLIVDKMKVGDMGFSAYVQDTEGNIIGLWQITRGM